MNGETSQLDPLVYDLLSRVFDDGEGRLTETRIAELVGFSVTHIRRVFFDAMGEPLGDFIRRVWLERAAGQLITGTQSIRDIALAARYQSPEAFTKAFRRWFDCAPSTFREINHGPLRLLPGFLYSYDLSQARGPNQVGLFTADEHVTTHVYADASYVGQIKPEGPADRKGRLYSDGHAAPLMVHGLQMSGGYEPPRRDLDWKKIIK